jgi:hypothetical protein
MHNTLGDFPPGLFTISGHCEACEHSQKVNTGKLPADLPIPVLLEKLRFGRLWESGDADNDLLRDRDEYQRLRADIKTPHPVEGGRGAAGQTSVFHASALRLSCHPAG